jgi:HK97 family phage major capsid protein
MAEITRAEALALMAEERVTEIWQESAKTSQALSFFRTVPMGKKEKIIPFLEAFPATPSGGPFINGDTGRKPTLDMSWALKTMVAEEIAGIVPVPENVLADADIDIWGEVRPRIGEYVALAVDAAVFGGVNAPASWPTGGLVGVATTAGNVLDLSTYLATAGGQAAGIDLAGAYSELLGLVEDDGFDADLVVASRAQRRRLRNLRDGDGNPVYSTSLRNSGGAPQIWDTDLGFWASGNASPVASNVHAVALARKYAIIGLRSDMEFKLLDQATLTDGAGNVTVSLAEQDMLALRFKIRLGFSYMDPTTIEAGAGASPFAVMVE